MISILCDQIDFLGKQVGQFGPPGATTQSTSDSDRNQVADAVAISISLFERISESCPHPSDPSIAHWYRQAQALLQVLRAYKSNGIEVEGISAFMRAYLQAKTAVESYPAAWRASEEAVRSENSTPLEEV